MTVAKHLRAWLAAADLSQNKLADKLGTTQSQVCRWCNGKAVPRGDVLLKIIGLCGLEVRDKGDKR